MSGSPSPKTKSVRYVRTSALTRVIEPLDARCILEVSAIRSVQNDSSPSVPIPYVRYSDRQVTSLDLDYNAFRHGPFDKAGVLASVGGTLGEAVIQNLDLLLPTRFSELVGEAAGAEPAKSELARHQYIAHLEHYPVSREGEKNQFYADLDACMTDDERQWMERGSLDLQFFLPVETYRDLSLKRGRVGEDFRDQIEEWQERIGSNPPLVRAAFELLFPDPDIRNVRVYRWDAQERWVLSGVGES